MENIEKLVDQANDLFEQGELAIEDSVEKGHELFLQGIALLLKSCLILNGVNNDGGIKDLFAECKKLEPDFGNIEEELNCLIEADFSFNDQEDIIDSANEVWDFIIELITED